MDMNPILREQLSRHWESQLRPRLDGLSDEEYLWEPAPGSWNVRPGGPGEPVAIDFAFRPPSPEPVTTIAWRLAHVVVGVLAVRNAAHFGGPPASYETWRYAATADEALAQLDEQYAAWVAGVTSLGEAGLERPAGEAEGPYAEASMATLVAHIHREVIHHLAEVCLLRDLWAHGVR